ncbi:hypothetical protein BCT45_05300 [Vibrio breoganii]|uniref:Stealth CR1 domain-containing protein n=1 Tax=Vibrio breoganii TaxID=553239 RepID=UPI000C82D300|nr:Stealth CR1 domain-containing protein [Vibrio breoganii]PMM86850.1 hypothetical protein BCT45_05300 [Vibrio breoganii]
MTEIDFVVTWVDDSDPVWLKDYKKHRKTGSLDSSSVRFRNWDNFHYWFRGVEKFAPWVRKVHLITSGHIPKWLNLENPKLNIVRHADYIDQKYLPTFSSIVIENNIPFIKGIAEHFVLFNDDFFLTSHTKAERFFSEGLPCDMAVQNALSGDGNAQVIMNIVELLNQDFPKGNILRNNVDKWFNLKYRKYLLKNFFLMPWPRFTGFVEPHLPQPYIKSLMKLTYEKYQDEFIKTNCFRFRDKSNINHYIYRYVQLLSGKFKPFFVYDKAWFYSIDDTNYIDVCKSISSGKYQIIVINDSKLTNFEQVRAEVNSSLDNILPNKSSFEN